VNMADPILRVSVVSTGQVQIRLERRHIDLPGLRWHRIEPELTGEPDLAPFRSGHDLFGDGSLVLLATPGHTPGSMSVLVRRPGLPPLIMVGDRRCA
jgi:N-acyl homoserine lactone hydrolase